MLFLAREVFTFLTIFGLILLQSCSLEGYDDAEFITVEGNDSKDENSTLRIWEIDDIAIGFNGAQGLIDNVAYWGYESGYSWIEGEQFRDNEMLNINVEKRKDHLSLMFQFDLNSFQPFPIIYDYNFNNKEEADYLHVELIIRNNQNSKKIKLTDHITLSSDGAGTFRTELELEDFKDLALGNVLFTAELKTAFSTFFDIRSKIKPISAKLSFNYEVPQLYKTKLFFKSLRLNKEETRDVLGDNDFNNSTPETGIQIKYNGKSVLYEFSKNSFSYVHSHNVDIYHLTQNAFVDIRVLDVDYGFNGNDIINDTTLNLKSLEGTDYFNLKMKCVNELLIYTQSKGKAN